MNSSLVSIICLCYNQRPFVKESILSALNQTYRQVEVIIVDDGSTDGSQEIIREFTDHIGVSKVILNDSNIGNTKAFNLGLKEARGEYIIDLACDDVLHPQRVQKGVEAFSAHDDSYGVNFTNTEFIDEGGKSLNTFYDINSEGQAIKSPPQGDLYSKLIAKYFIDAATMMVRRSVFDRLKGYDEKLTYEDFDFWIRSARDFEYCYTDAILIKRRKLAHSMSTRHYGYRSRQMKSTYEICLKIKQLNQTPEEDKALRVRIYYEMKQCLRYGYISLFVRYLILLRSV